MTWRQVVNKLLFLKPLLNTTFLLCLVSIIYLFLFSSVSQQDQYALPSLLLALWSLLFSALLGLLANALDEKVTGSSWLSRIRYKLAKGLFTIFVVAFIFITLAVLHITVKLFSVWL